jgi:hypothetical protein
VIIDGVRQVKKCMVYVTLTVGLGGLVVIVPAVGPKVCTFIKPSRGRWIFKGDKNP